MLTVIVSGNAVQHQHAIFAAEITPTMTFAYFILSMSQLMQDYLYVQN